MRPPPPDHDLVRETVKRVLGRDVDGLHLQPLPGDASNRAYYRLTLSETEATPPASLVLMQLADPEGFKQSEEAASESTMPITELPFVNVWRYLASGDLPVPRLYGYDHEAGLLYLEDFGDDTLARIAGGASSARLRSLYEEAIDLLVAMQARGGAILPPHYKGSDSGHGCLAFGRRFDERLLRWEFDHFLEFGVEARAGRTMDPEDRRAADQAFHRIAEYLAGLPRVFTHRDYHARNLMVLEPDGPSPRKRLGLLDFQDALVGPITYDLASLLRDAYITLDEGLVDMLVERYRLQVREWAAHATDQDVLIEKDVFRYAFDLTCLQRNLKAIGRFVYIDRVKQNPSFLDDIPRTLSYVRRNLLAYAELAPLRESLVRYVPELA